MTPLETLPSRTYLFAPGNHPRKVEKCLTVGADAVVLDLEDAVANDQKTPTRDSLVEALKKPRACRAYVRVNSFETPWCFDDLLAVVGPGLDGIVLPKTESAAQLIAVDWVLNQLERRHQLTEGSIDLMPIIETARGLAQINEICQAATRIRRLAFGAGDLHLDLNLRWEPEERALADTRARLVLASRVAELEPPIDTVVLQIKDHDRFELSARNGLEMGFQGKLCIHPDQVAPANRIFSPSDEEIAHARSVVAAFEAAEAEGSASIQLDGYFIDYPIVYKAQRILSLAERLED
ncbi:MAG: CoA ester lyase [Pseudomonadota bacterium]